MVKHTMTQTTDPNDLPNKPITPSPSSCSIKEPQKSQRKVAIAGHHPYEVALSSLLPSNVNRSRDVYQMLQSYEAIWDKLDKLGTYEAHADEICKFHDEKFVRFLMKERECDYSGVNKEALETIEKYDVKKEMKGEDEEDEEEWKEFEGDDKHDLDKYGLKYDCPIFPYLPQYIKHLAGSSLTSARYIITQSKAGIQPIAINWNGGRHHARKAIASGFCYINDITLSILELRKKFDKVAYIDLDLHHGDGVENSFKFSDKVLTVSLHRKEVGFFPGTGAIEDKGLGKGMNWTVNFPLKHGLCDDNFIKVLKETVVPLLEKSGVECLVVQCGGDGLGSDDYKEWNLSIRGFGEAVKTLLNLKKPTLLLGGGGYDNGQMARLNTYLTSIALEMYDYKFDILPNAGELDDTSDEYEFWNVPKLRMRDKNDAEYLDHLKDCILARFK